MNLLKETKSRKEYNQKCLDDLNRFMIETNVELLTKDCLWGIKKDTDKFKHNIEYYDGIIKVLEENN